MLKKVLILMALLLGGVPLLWAGTVTIDGVPQGTLGTMSVDQNGNVDITCNNSGNCNEQVVVAPSTLSFAISTGQTTNPPQQAVSVKDGCVPAANLAFTVTGTSKAWVLASPTSGNGTLNVTVDAASITQNDSATITMNVQGATGTVQKTVNVSVTYSQPSSAALLAANDSNMLYGEAKGIQSVDRNSAKYYKFVLPAQCNKVVVAWTTFDWIGKVDMLVKAGSSPTLSDWNAAISGGYPATASGPSLWYNLLQASGDGGESVTMSYVPAGTYYIMMQNTNTVDPNSKFKVWYAPNCSWVPR